MKKIYWAKEESLLKSITVYRQTLRAKENFKIIGYKMDKDFIKALGMG